MCEVRVSIHDYYSHDAQKALRTMRCAYAPVVGFFRDKNFGGRGFKNFRTEGADVSDVKRLYVPPVIGRIQSGVPTVEVVAADDYDALAARLVETQRLDSIIVKDLSARIAQLEGKLNQATDSCAKYAGRIAQLEGKLNQATDSCAKYAGRIAQLEATLAARHKQLAVLWDVLARNERVFALANEAMAALAREAT